jgi:hypothetical protein
VRERADEARATAVAGVDELGDEAPRYGELARGDGAAWSSCPCEIDECFDDEL